MGEQLDIISSFLASKAPFKPLVGVVCGSGLGGLTDVLENPVSIDYSDIPSFPKTTVAGHSGKVVFGSVGKTNIVALKGRFHSYEGHEMKVTALPGWLFKKLGCEYMVVTNACGGIAKHLSIGDVMVLSDHISLPLLAGKNPLVGANDDSLGPRFPAVSHVYAKSLRALCITKAKKLNQSFVQPKGVYCMVSGPNYETAAECLFLRRIGADAVGMSTVPEVTAAAHAGLKVLGLSLITNKVVLPGDESTPPATHEEVLETGRMRAAAMQDLVKEVLEELSSDDWESRVESESEEKEKKDSADSEAEVLEEIRSLNIASLTPLEALNTLSNIQAKLT